jgi:hypothetical protein
MYWPENEPLPSIEQIRPSPALVSAQAQASCGLRLGQESTANHQMGDWDCGKCQFQVTSLTFFSSITDKTSTELAWQEGMRELLSMCREQGQDYRSSLT